MSRPRARTALLWMVTALVVGCGSSEGTPSPAPAAPALAPSTPEGRSSDETAPAAEPPSVGPDDAPPGDRSPSRDTSTACARVEACCAGYVGAIGDDAEAQRAQRACDELERLETLGDAAGEACLAAIEGWRQSLELRGREVPAPCR